MRLKFKWLAAWLLLAAMSSASSQTWTVYFVFRLATALPVTLQATPECEVDRAAWEAGTAAPETGSPLRLLETYSFVSGQSPAELQGNIEAFAQDLGFSGADLWAQEQMTGDGKPGAAVQTQEFQGPQAPGYHYGLRIYPRLGTSEVKSVLCITVRLAPGTGDTSPTSPDN
ncbi:hypothetical protein [Deinococcus apachensis]|uniref:hypothetical protein n=1 Tax=Deinococcus apachensis TaxID=309886 RepID=UPI0003752127|nr:hypothetical protein [Deinococcus apachensis]